MGRHEASLNGRKVKRISGRVISGHFPYQKRVYRKLAVISGKSTFNAPKNRIVLGNINDLLRVRPDYAPVGDDGKKL